MTAWILSLLLWLSPPARAAAPPAFPGWAETAEQRSARYLSIAEDIALGLSEYTAPEQKRLGAVLVAIAWLESGFSPDVDIGPCFRPKPISLRCDGGNAFSMWQLRVGAGATSEGWTGADLQADRRKAIRVALRLIQHSRKACARFGPEASLRAYASGSCERGQAASAERVRLARRLLARP